MSETKISINKNEKVVGMKKTSTLWVEITGDQKLVDNVESAVKTAVSGKIEGKK